MFTFPFNNSLSFQKAPFAIPILAFTSFSDFPSLVTQEVDHELEDLGDYKDPDELWSKIKSSLENIAKNFVSTIS